MRVEGLEPPRFILKAGYFYSCVQIHTFIWASQCMVKTTNNEMCTKCVPTFRWSAWATPPSYDIYIQPLPDWFMKSWHTFGTHFVVCSLHHALTGPNKRVNLHAGIEIALKCRRLCEFESHLGHHLSV